MISSQARYDHFDTLPYMYPGIWNPGWVLLYRRIPLDRRAFRPFGYGQTSFQPTTSADLCILPHLRSFCKSFLKFSDLFF